MIVAAGWIHATSHSLEPATFADLYQRFTKGTRTLPFGCWTLARRILANHPCSCRFHPATPRANQQVTIKHELGAVRIRAERQRRHKPANDANLLCSVSSVALLAATCGFLMAPHDVLCRLQHASPRGFVTDEFGQSMDVSPAGALAPSRRASWAPVSGLTPRFAAASLGATSPSGNSFTLSGAAHHRLSEGSGSNSAVESEPVGGSWRSPFAGAGLPPRGPSGSSTLGKRDRDRFSLPATGGIAAPRETGVLGRQSVQGPWFQTRPLSAVTPSPQHGHQASPVYHDGCTVPEPMLMHRASQFQAPLQRTASGTHFHRDGVSHDARAALYSPAASAIPRHMQPPLAAHGEGMVPPHWPGRLDAPRLSEVMLTADALLPPQRPAGPTYSSSPSLRGLPPRPYVDTAYAYQSSPPLPAHSFHAQSSHFTPSPASAAGMSLGSGRSNTSWYSYQTPTSVVSTDTGDDATPSSGQRKVKPIYRCKRCGEIKKGHHCAVLYK